ncbi:hypothetical protein H4R26_001111 [Coemansia thaxteri]|uniref:Uncharacterized protein n=1 Tax=Coemansia thaxteri TaxID=2663907 RepID=A0A9W8BHD9_9FUNG|nr:hypothetical protein H4R26_001111 [Coemansia thaxteri]
MATMPRSDSKYNNQTVAVRAAGDQRRARQQRRKTDGSEEIQSMRRPSTSHAASPPRKVAYSQYPDFESITDPFAKRDKIPQKSKNPVVLDAAVIPGVAAVPFSAEDLVAGSNRHNGNTHTSKAKSSKDLAQFSSGGSSGRSRLAPRAMLSTPPDSASISASISAPISATALATTGPDSALADPQVDVPTPLKVRDKIPRYANQSTIPASQQRAAGGEPRLARMDSATGPTPAVGPETPTRPRAANNGPPRSMGKALLISTLVSPVSPTLLPRERSRHQTREPHSADSEMSNLTSPGRPFSGHKSSPRLLIDMDKVDTLYARRSVIFEKNKSKREQLEGATAVSPTDAHSRLAASGIGAGSLGTLDESEDPKDGDDPDDIEDKESEHYIPFDQVLIPTAFKRLRKALEDPSYDIDEETYRRFKLSERWYSREERVQMERAFNKGTFGESKKRSRIIQKRLSELSSTESSALGHHLQALNSGDVHGLSEDAPEVSDRQHSLPTPPMSALSPHNRRLESLQEEDASCEPKPVLSTTAPERRRTRSSRRPDRHRVTAADAPDAAAWPRQASLPRGYIPPMDPAYPAPPGGRGVGAASEHIALEETAQQVPAKSHRHRSSSRRHRPAATRTEASAETHVEKTSTGCCVCTIM